MSSAERLLDVLTVVATASEPVPAKRVAETAGIPLSSAYRHLALLKDRGFIADLGRDSGFGPGPICLRIGINFDRTSFTLATALPEMQKLSLRTQESVGLMKAVGAEVFCLEMIESPLSLRCSFSRGRSQPLSRGASAKALLAFLPAGVREEICDRLFGREGKAREEVAEELGRIRTCGYAQTEGEVDEGVWGVSAPIFSHSDRLEGSISLMVPSMRVGNRAADLIRQTVETAKTVSACLDKA